VHLRHQPDGGPAVKVEHLTRAAESSPVVPLTPRRVHRRKSLGIRRSPVDWWLAHREKYYRNPQVRDQRQKSNLFSKKLFRSGLIFQTVFQFLLYDFVRII
jgi:hypothetical protein